MDVASIGQTATNSAAEAASGKLAENFDTFLTLLVAQLQNQDPLDPVKSEDFTVQLATFSGVEQQVLTNDLLRDLASQAAVSGMAQFAGWVGMEARAPVGAYFDGDAISLVPEPDLSADRAELVVTNAFGAEIHRSQIELSKDPINWTGELGSGNTAPTGIYTFTVESFSDGALTSSRQAEVYAKVVEARTSGSETIIIAEGGVEIPTSSVTALREPGA